MVSAIDPTKPADDVPAVKLHLRNNLAAAKAEIEALQAATANLPGGTGTYYIQGDARYFTAAATFTSGSDLITIAGGGFTSGRVGQELGVRQSPDDTLPAFRRVVTEVLSDTQLRMSSAAPHSGSGWDVIVGPYISAELVAAITAGFRRIEFRGAVLHEHITFNENLIANLRVELIGFEGAIIYRRPDVFGFTQGRMFNVTNRARVTFKDLHLHATRYFQAEGGGIPWARDHGTQQMHAINVSANLPADAPTAYVYNCTIEETGGEGVSLAGYSSGHVYDTFFRNCFRGGITTLTATANLYSGRLKSADDLTATGASLSGITNEVIGGPLTGRQIIQIDGWDMGPGRLSGTTTGDNTGEFLDPLYNSSITYRNIRQARDSVAPRGSFRTSNNCRLDIIDSTLIGGPDYVVSDLWLTTNMLGHNIHCSRVQFVASMKGLTSTQAPAASCMVITAYNDANYPRGSIMTFTDCEFIIGNDVPDDVTVCAIDYRLPDSFTTGLINATRLPPVNIQFTRCHFAGRSSGSDQSDTRIFDTIMKGTNKMIGHVAFQDCVGEAKIGFELHNDRSGYLTLGGHMFTTTDRFMKLTNASGVDRKLYLNWNGVVMDSANAVIQYDNAAAYPSFGSRVIMVPHDPTAVTQSVTTLLMESANFKRGIYGFRLPPGQGIVPGSVRMINTFGGPITYTDQGNGTFLSNAATPQTGTIDYSTGTIRLVYPGINYYWTATYSYNQGVCGLRGDVAVLYTDPLAKWVCTVPASHGLPATWVAV